MSRGTPWTDAERARLRRDYGRLPAAQLARALGRSVKAIYQQAKALGLCRQKRAVLDAAFQGRLRRYQGQGWCDSDIAAALGCDRHTVSRLRRELGLASNARGPRWRRKIRARLQEQLARAGLDNLAQVRAAVFAARARAAGWPADLAAREVDILEALMARGPLTRPEIAAAIGAVWRGTRRSLKSRTAGGSYLATLVRRGLVVCVPRGRPVRGQGKGRSCHLYIVPLWVYAQRGRWKEKP